MGKLDPVGIVKVITRAVPLAVPVAIVTGAEESEHKFAELKVVLRGQLFSVEILPPAHVTVIVNFAVSIVPEFLMKAYCVFFEFTSVIAAPVAAPPGVALG